MFAHYYILQANMSLGGTAPVYFLETAIQAAIDEGVLVATSSGTYTTHNIHTTRNIHTTHNIHTAHTIHILLTIYILLTMYILLAICNVHTT